ncbi:MAG: ferrochelatase [Ignavibacteriae bacterium]|nr:MAG: ferrochelatase [Ignavibacteriota bacterium]
MKTAVVLFNLGGPDSLKAIEPFLYNLFRDPDIVKLPFGQKLFAKIISNRRAPKVAKSYKLIGGKSPINGWTEIQRKMLEEKLRKNYSDISVFTAMRYWHPLIESVVEKIKKKNFSKIILLPLYPHWSISTTGSSFNEWNRYFNKTDEQVFKVESYQTNLLYIAALNERINQALLKFPKQIRKEVQLVFSAHGTPLRMVKSGDPYSNHINETISAVMKNRNYSHKHHLCFQSKVGPVKWLTPATDTMLIDLAKDGKKNLLIIPISFVSDHLETSFELDIEYRHVANENNIENYIVMEGLNDSELFISALYDEVKKIIEKNNG